MAVSSEEPAANQYIVKDKKMRPTSNFCIFLISEIMLCFLIAAQPITIDTNYNDKDVFNDLFPADWNIDIREKIDYSVYNQKHAGPEQVIDSILAARLQYIIDSIRIASGSGTYPIKGISAAAFIPWQGTWTGVTGTSFAIYNITPGMKFGVASNTKLFIATMILKLAEQNILSLNDSLYMWLPHFQYVDSTITIRQLLNHTSGVFNFTAHPNWWSSIMGNPNRLWTPEETMSTFMNPPYFPPGQGWEYSNTNYLLAGMIIRNITDTLVSYNLRQFIINPINLNSTYFDVEENIPDTIAGAWHNNQYYSTIPRTSQYSSIWTAGAMFSTGENMVRWYHNLFTGQVINQSSLNQMLTFVSGYDAGYGLGIMRHVESGLTIFYHIGSFPGYMSYCSIDSASKICVAALINTSPSNPVETGTALLNAILNHIIGITKNSETVPTHFRLFQNYPNPFNPVTNIKFDLPIASGVKLTVFDILGREVEVLVNEFLKPGTYRVDWDASKFSSGTYFYKLETEKFNNVKKMILIK